LQNRWVFNSTVFFRSSPSRSQKTVRRIIRKRALAPFQRTFFRRTKTSSSKNKPRPAKTGLILSYDLNQTGSNINFASSSVST
jgi:hypothetical protein